MEREKFGSRLGFILISAGCAIGLGNVWRFPYITGKYGGALFILIYLAFLILFGVPIMTMEFAVGRASRKSAVESFRTLEPKGKKWHLFGYIAIAGNYLLMMFYTTVTGWMFAYFFKMLHGDFTGAEVTAEYVAGEFSGMMADPFLMIFYMVLVVGLGFLICSLGLQKGVEKITKWMMLALLAIIAVLAIHSATLDGAGEGLRYYLIPSLDGIRENGLGQVITAAMGQAFFTLSIGMACMSIFGSYIDKDKRLLGESITIATLDTMVAFFAGLIIIPACFAYSIEPGQGPGLIFVTLPSVFNNMAGGRLWGTLFFLFMIFAALSTVVTVFEVIIAFFMDTLGWSRKKACLVNFIGVAVLSLPCIFGFNLLSGFQPLGAGSTVLDLEDFIISNNILPLGSLIYVLFCTWNKKTGWGWDHYLEEVNTGRGLRFPKWMRMYMKFVMPVAILVLWVQGYISMFFS